MGIFSLLPGWANCGIRQGNALCPITENRELSWCPLCRHCILSLRHIAVPPCSGDNVGTLYYDKSRFLVDGCDARCLSFTQKSPVCTYPSVERKNKSWILYFRRRSSATPLPGMLPSVEMKNWTLPPRSVVTAVPPPSVTVCNVDWNWRPNANNRTRNAGHNMSLISR